MHGAAAQLAHATLKIKFLQGNTYVPMATGGETQSPTVDESQVPWEILRVRSNAALFIYRCIAPDMYRPRPSVRVNRDEKEPSIRG